MKQSPSPATARVGTPLTRWLHAVIWGAALIPLTFFSSACWWGYEWALASGQDRVTRANRVTLRHAQRTFSTVTDISRQASSLAARPDAELRGAEADIRQRLQDMVLGVSAVQAITIWDDSGRVVVSTADNALTKLTSIADRPYFLQAKSASNELFFSDPIKGRISGLTLINAVTRRNHPDGSFAGIVVVLLLPGFFQDFYQSLASDESGLGTFAMFRTDGSVLARWPPLPELVHLPKDSLLTVAAEAGRPQGLVRVASKFDGRLRMISFMRVPGLPIYASAALDESAIFDPWHRLVVLLAAVLGPVTIGLVYVSWVALKKTRREQVVLLELQAEMRRRVRTEKALVQAQRLEALSVLTGGVAHDFNNLLAIVNGNIHMIRRLHAEVGNGKHLNAIARAVASGVRLTRQLLSFARRQALKPEQIRLQTWLPGMSDLLASTLGTGIELRIEVAPGLAPIDVDAGELELALINLATNAKDAMPQRGSLRVQATPAPLDAAGGQGVTIRVRDTGIGIEPDLLPKVFEPFFTTKPPNKGTGLGLSQVYGFCMQAGGTATVESEPGRGTSVTMTFPADLRAVSTGSDARESPAAERLSGRVLLVEDNEDVATTHRELLESVGISVDVEHSADAALRTLANAGWRHQLVLSDVTMPGTMDGIQLALQLRELHTTLPVLLVTGYAARLQEAAAAGFTVLAKPVEPDHLLAEVGRVLRAEVSTA